MSAPTWPEAQLSDIARLRILAESMPGLALHERVIDVPFDEVWGFIADLEHSVPAFDRDVTSLRIRSRVTGDHGERLDIVARGPWWMGWFPHRFDVDLRSGWCWMVTRPQTYIVGMAAEPDGDRTRYAHLEGIAVPAGPRLQRVLRPLFELSRRRHRRHIRHDVDGIVRETKLRRLRSKEPTAPVVPN
jgi:hypothetical protein